MARNSARAWMRIGVAVASWVAAVSVAQAVNGADIARKVQELEERIELQLKGTRAPPEPQPERSHEEESFESWELVSV
jgi:hypothetical protein